MPKRKPKEAGVSEPTELSQSTDLMPSELPDTPARNDKPAAPAPAKSRKRIGLLAIVVAVIAVLLGGSAAAYYGVIVPNKPENTIKKAISNSIAQKKTKFEGKISYESTDQAASVKAVNATFNGSSDADADAFSLSTEIVASGVKLPVELRHIDKNLYFKLGDLSNLKGLVQKTYPAYAPTFDALNTKLANQWVEVDQTLLKQVNADCALSTGLALTDADIATLEKRYEEIPFTNVKSTSNDTVNGHSVTKYEIEIDKKKAAEYANGLQDLSVVKKIKECTASKAMQNSDNSTSANDGVTPLTVWVDKSTKQIVKLAVKTTPNDEAKYKTKLSLEVTMQYGQAEIVKPEGAKPLLEVLGDFSQLFGMNNSAFALPTANPAQQPQASLNGVTQECLQAIQDYTNSGGVKPIPSCL